MPRGKPTGISYRLNNPGHKDSDLLPGKKSSSNFRSWIQYIFVVPNAIGSLMDNLTGDAPVAMYGIRLVPVAVAPHAVRCGSTPNAFLMLAAVHNGLRILTGMKILMKWLMK